MTEFLNTDRLIERIPALMMQAKKDLIIVVPFIQLSESMRKALSHADTKNVEITIICRYKEVKPKDAKFLESLKNINIFSHPNVHAKCYYNEENVIITSLNLTSHSERNNREMGVQVYKYEQFEDDMDAPWENEEFEDFENDLVTELQNLLNGSTYLVKSASSQKEGFNCSLMTTHRDRLEELCKKVNKKFSPKRFRVEDLEYVDYLICENYFDKINLRIKDINQRFEFEPNKGAISIWNKKLKPLHQKSFEIEYKGEQFEFTIYLNTGAKLNIVGYHEELELEDLLVVWERVLSRVSNYFTPELLKI